MNRPITRTANYKEEIIKIFSFLSTEISIKNRYNLTDINVHMEDLVCGILNLLGYGNFENANIKNQNEKGFDLFDGTTYIQVTSDTSVDKVKKTIENIKICKIKNIKMLYLSDKKPNRRKETFTGKYEDFNPKQQQICFKDFIDKAEQEDSIESLYKFLESQLNYDIPNIEWFKTDFDHKISLVKDRYRPTQNIQIDENDRFKQFLFKSESSRLIELIRELESVNENTLLSDFKYNLEGMPKYMGSSNSYNVDEVKSLVEFLLSMKQSIIGLIENYFNNNESINEVIKCFDIYSNKKFSEKYYKFYGDGVEKLYDVIKLDKILLELNRELKNYLEFENQSIFFILGETGIGKTHFLFDMCKLSLDNGFRSKIILGRTIKYSLEEVKNVQVKEKFDLDKICKSLDFSQENSYLFIDGINESNYFKENFEDFMTKINYYTEEYPNIKIILSLREEYINIFNIYEYSNSYHFYLKGFGNYDIQETLNNYNIVLPSNEFFTNPNYLFMFCETYKGEKISKLPTIEALFKKYLDSKKSEILKLFNYKNSKKVSDKRLYEKVIDGISKYRFDNNISELLNNTDNILINIENFQLNSDLLNDVIIYMEECGLIEIYNEDFSFTFNVVQDYLDSKYTLENNLEIINDGQLYMMAKLLPILKKQEIFQYENINLEIEYSIYDSFLNSLSEREDNNIIPDITLNKVEIIFYELVNNIEKFKKLDKNYKESKEFIQYKNNLESFWNNLIGGSLYSKKIFECISKLLLSLSLPVRDIMFTTYVNNLYDYNKSILIDKFFQNRIENLRDAEEFFLLMFLCSSNRELRDNLTKKLIVYYENKLYELIETTKKYFLNINDDYILERITSIVLGVLYRNIEINFNVELFDVLNQIYLTSSNYLVLSNINQSISRLNLVNNKNYNLENKEINFNEPLGNEFNKLKEVNSRVSFSIANNKGYQPYDDWGRYYIEGKFESFVKPTGFDKEKAYQDFRKSLSNEQINKLDFYESENNKVEFIFSEKMDIDEYGYIKGFPVIKKDLELEEFLNQDDVILYDEIVDKKEEYIPVLEGKKLDDKIASEIINLVGDYIGYDVINVYSFWRNNYYDSGRSTHIRERLSKKYQWISYYKLVSQLAFNFKVKGIYSDEEIPRTPNFVDDIDIVFDPLVIDYTLDKIDFYKIYENFYKDKKDFICNWDKVDDSLIKNIIDIKSGILPLNQTFTSYQIGCELWYQSVAYAMNEEELDEFLNEMMINKKYYNAYSGIPSNVGSMLNYTNIDSNCLIIDYSDNNGGYDYSHKSDSILYSLNTKLLEIDDVFLYKQNLVNMNNDILAKTFKANDNNFLFINKEFLKKTLFSINKKLYYFVVYGKEIYNKKILSERVEKKYVVLYEYDLERNKTNLIDGYKYNMDEPSNEKTYYNIDEVVKE